MQPACVAQTHSHWSLFGAALCPQTHFPMHMRLADQHIKIISSRLLKSSRWWHLSSPKKWHPTQLHMGNRNHDDSGRGSLIVLEGLDRSGKSSQCLRLASYLEGQGLQVEAWRFPDRTTAVGEMISSYLTNKSQLDDRTIHLLFSANRWEKRSLMEAKLKSGISIVLDRYSYSGVAFSAAKGLDIEWCKAPESGLIAPDLVVYLDIPPEEAAKRGEYGLERYEKLEFQREVGKNYQLLQDSTWKVIDARLSVDAIGKEIQDLVVASITSCRKGKALANLWL